MASSGKKAKEFDPEALVVVYARIRAGDLAELQRRESESGATVAAQIRILVHEALTGRRFVK
jgi:hypothetical protein